MRRRSSCTIRLNEEQPLPFNCCSTKGIANQVVTWFPTFTRTIARILRTKLQLSFRDHEGDGYPRNVRSLIPFRSSRSRHRHHQRSHVGRSFSRCDNEKECRTAKWTFIVFYTKRCCCRFSPPIHFGFQEISGGHVFLIRIMLQLSRHDSDTNIQR